MKTINTKESKADFIKLFVHSDKAIKKGAVPNRLYVAVSKDEDGYYYAWKTVILDNGKKFLHPKTMYVKKHTLAKIIEMSQTWNEKKGSSPTAQFKHDSFYKKFQTTI